MQASILPHPRPRTGRSIAGWVAAVICLAVMKRRNSSAAPWLTGFGCVSAAVSRRLDQWRYKWCAARAEHRSTASLSGDRHGPVHLHLKCICVYVCIMAIYLVLEVFSVDLFCASWAQREPFNWAELTECLSSEQFITIGTVNIVIISSYWTSRDGLWTAVWKVVVISAATIWIFIGKLVGMRFQIRSLKSKAGLTSLLLPLRPTCTPQRGHG